MIIYCSSLSLTYLLYTPSFLRPCGVSPLPRLRALELKGDKWKNSKKIKVDSQRGRRAKGVCRAELALDAPFAAAIGACVLTSLVFPISSGGPDDEEDSGGAFDSTDARFAVMGIISFIPYFNWLSWVFAWLDSGRQRYLVYSIVYLAPYLRTNLSLSPEESWLPITSIFICIIHIQLEASIRNGDLNGIQLFGGALKLFSPLIKEDTEFGSRQRLSKKARGQKQVELPSAQNIRVEIGETGHPKKPVHDSDHLNENHDVIAEENKSD